MVYPSEPYIVNIIRYYDVDITAGSGGSVNLDNGRFEEGTQLVVTATPEDGYHFTQWSDGVSDNPRTLSVNGPISLVAEFTPNCYMLTFVVDGEIYNEYEMKFGSEIVPEVEPEKEGYTFSGWEGLPETMPAHDITVSGSFSINSYEAIFRIGDEIIDTKTIVYGGTVESPEAPAKEGYTFAGWQEVPETMPAHDIEITGSYDINSYLLSIYLNGELISSEMVEYGTKIEIQDPEVPDGMKFVGWTDIIPEYMPAHDVEIHGTYEEVSSVAFTGLEENIEVTVYDMKGCLLHHGVPWVEAKDLLPDGIYMVNGIKLMIRH